MEFKNRNKIARIRFNDFNGFIVLVSQVSKAGGEMIEDHFDSKFGFKTLKGAQKWAQKVIQ